MLKQLIELADFNEIYGKGKGEKPHKKTTRRRRKQEKDAAAEKQKIHLLAKKGSRII